MNVFFKKSTNAPIIHCVVKLKYPNFFLNNRNDGRMLVDIQWKTNNCLDKNEKLWKKNIIVLLKIKTYTHTTLVYM